jgi:hypothetical protein
LEGKILFPDFCGPTKGLFSDYHPCHPGRGFVGLLQIRKKVKAFLHLFVPDLLAQPTKLFCHLVSFAPAHPHNPVGDRKAKAVIPAQAGIQNKIELLSLLKQNQSFRLRPAWILNPTAAKVSTAPACLK